MNNYDVLLRRYAPSPAEWLCGVYVSKPRSVPRSASVLRTYVRVHVQNKSFKTWIRNKCFKKFEINALRHRPIITSLKGGGSKFCWKRPLAISRTYLPIVFYSHMITPSSEVEKNRNPDVFKWSKGFCRYFNDADNIFNFSSFFRAQGTIQCPGGQGRFRLKK